RLPDYLYTVSLLHQRDIHPRLDYLETRNRLGGTRDFEEFAQRVAWAFGPIDAEQRAELQRWYQADPERARSGGAPMRWAFISWEIPQPSSHQTPDTIAVGQANGVQRRSERHNRPGPRPRCPGETRPHRYPPPGLAGRYPCRADSAFLSADGTRPYPTRRTRTTLSALRV